MKHGSWWHWKLNKELLAIKDWDTFLGTKNQFNDDIPQEEMEKRIIQCEIATNMLKGFSPIGHV